MTQYFDASVVKQGWLSKKSKHFKKYNKRFMVLQDATLKSYKTSAWKVTKLPPTESFDLSCAGYRVEKHKSIGKKFYLINDETGQYRTFRATNTAELDEWMYYLREAITSNQQKNKWALSQPKAQEQVWNWDFATFESELGHQNEDDFHDSDSADSEGEFGKAHKNGSNSKPFKSKRKLSARKQKHTLSSKSFVNFRIRSLTVDNDADDEEDEDDGDNDIHVVDDATQKNQNIYAIESIDEEKEERDDDEDGDDDIVTQFNAFGYATQDIKQAMQQVTDPSNMTQIKEKLDTQVGAIVEQENENDISSTPSPQSPPIMSPMSTESSMSNDSVHVDMIERQRHFIERELVSTEQTYVDGLNTLLHELIQPMFDQKFVAHTHYEKIRSSLPKIYAFHQIFLAELQQVNNVETHRSLANTFNDCIQKNEQHFVDIYSIYVQQYNDILHLVAAMNDNTQLTAFLKEKRKERKPLSSFLILPVQRVPRYILLLTDLLKHTESESADYNDLSAALDRVKHITNTINENKRKIENASQCLQIQQSLNGLKQPIVDDRRRFIQQFIFVKKEIKHQRLFFLFSDVLIIANEQWRVKLLLNVRTLDVKMSDHCDEQQSPATSSTATQLAEFKLISAGVGNVMYVAQTMDDVKLFRRLITKQRVTLIAFDLKKRNATIGSIQDELNRQELMYD